jgi:hypothetical protein
MKKRDRVGDVRVGELDEDGAQREEHDAAHREQQAGDEIRAGLGGGSRWGHGAVSLGMITREALQILRRR